jgi:hypothetical protein
MIRWTDEEHDQVARYVRGNISTIQDRADRNRWRRSPQFNALVADLADRRTEAAVTWKTMALMDWADIGQSDVGVWIHDAVWMQASWDRTSSDAQPETAEDIVRRLGGSASLYEDENDDENENG